ncbi:bifunctional DNA primase/polymerase [Pseudonocardia parietis]|uniref:DNA primase/polymerase bifunctional N-terminal domain-containing protein n=1 Tax=Pseudonocardia parietis TaxID=570936 RepID=A0ABS4W652_9PSEU|nr:bifunctional DNA primase/polymerase [Pseudonocardia parietis]MBP2371685.1 hypothetical protein [Pseudonocardia parietis]
MPRTRRRSRRQDPEVVRLRGAALDAAAAGLFVFPVKPGEKLPAVPRHAARHCRQRGICADGHQGWEQRATRDRAQIYAWWSGQPRFNVGIACGPSGIVVIDLDTSTDPLPDWGGATTGREVLDQLAARHSGELTDTYSTRTPTHGEHLYYRMPAGLELHNTTQGLSGSLGPLIDTRAWGGMAVGAGSVRPEGAYIVAEHGQITELPDWLATLLTPAPPPQRPAAVALPTRRANAYVAAILRDEVGQVAAAQAGSRQSTLYFTAYRLGRLVGGGELEADHVAALLREAAAGHIRDDAFGPDQANDAIARGLHKGAEDPRYIDEHTSTRDDDTADAGP